MMRNQGVVAAAAGLVPFGHLGCAAEFMCLHPLVNRGVTSFRLYKTACA
jgi:hypothetical protein